jgi:ribonuclease Z
LDALVENTSFEQYQTNPSCEEDSARVVIHFTPKNILENPKYIQWMEKFRISTKHILISDLCYGMGSEAVHRIQHKLNLIDENMFPLLKGESPPSTDGEKMNFIRDVQLPIIMGTTLLRYNLRPGTGADDSSVLPLKPTEYVEDTMNTEDFPEQLTELKARFASMNTPKQEYPRIIFLGTGSCIPNKTRNTSGMLLQVT